MRVPNGTAKGAFLCIHYVPILIMQFRKPKPRMALLGSMSGSIKGMYRRNIVCPRQTECPMRSARGACLQQSAVEDAAVRAGGIIACPRRAVQRRVMQRIPPLNARLNQQNKYSCK